MEPTARRRVAIVRASTLPTVEALERYLPDNYRVIGGTSEYLTIAGHDVAGWTLDGYVIPRLASGLMFAQEVSA
jgi:hypothetical protein